MSILNSSSFSDFLSNYFLVSEILENDSDLLSSIEEQKLKIEKVNYDYHEIYSSRLETVLARGDRSLSKVILKAQENGCIFDTSHCLPETLSEKKAKHKL